MEKAFQTNKPVDFFRLKKRFLSTSVCALALSCSVAMAQEAALEEIIVTAQKRTSTIQDVPFSISAIKGEDIQRLGANGFETFANRVAGLQSIQTTPLDTQFSVRGVSSGAQTFDQIQQSSTVGIYFSEVATDVSAANPNFQLFDIERIEVLRGPQGTLYGAGSQSGAIRIIPNRPDLEKVSVGGGITLSDTRFGGTSQTYDLGINIPLVENELAFRAVGYWSDQAGVIDNITTGEKNEDDAEIKGGRAALRWTPNKRFTADLTFVHQEADLEGRGASFVDLERFETGSFFFQNDKSTLAELALAYDFDGVSVTSITGYLRKKQLIDLDASQVPVLLGLPFGFPSEFLTSVKAEIWSQELRLQSNSESALHWTVGGYYNQVDRSLIQFIDVPGIEDAFGFPVGAAFGTTPDRVLFTDFDTDNEQIAIFGEVGYRITEKLDVTLGARYFDGKQETVFDDAGIFVGGVFLDNFNSKEDGVNPSFNVSYDVNDDSSVYGRVARGFRLSGTNYFIPPGPCGADVAALGLDEVPKDFDSDKLWNYEVGSKNRLAGDQATLNVAAYYSEWKDIQSTVSLPCGYNFQDNLGRAEMLGFEIEVAWSITPELAINASFTYTDAEFKEAVPTLGVVGGERTPFTPKTAANFGFDYSRPVGDETTLFVSGDVQYQGDRVTGVTALDSFMLDDFIIANMRAGVQHGAWEAYLFANNLFDERAMYDRGVSSTSTVPGEFIVYARPRTIGITLRRGF